MTALRIGLLAAAGLLLRASYGLHLPSAPLIGQPLTVWTMIASGAAALVLFALAAGGPVRPWMRWLVLAACTADVLLRALILPSAGVDGAPSLWSELPLVFTRSVAIGGYLLALGLLFLKAPPALSPLLVVPLLIGESQLVATLVQDGSLNSVWAALLLLTMFVWPARRARAVAFGAALSLNALAWLLLPILWIRLRWTERPAGNAIAQFTGWSLAVVACIHLPQIIVHPAGWLLTVRHAFGGGPVQLPSGLAALSEYGVLALPTDFYRAAAVVAFGLFLILLYRHFDALERLSWALPALIAWMLPHLPPNEWIFWMIPGVGALLMPPVVVARSARFRVRTSLAWAGSAAILTLASAIAVASQRVAPVSVRVGYPLGVDARGRIIEVPLSITNASPDVLEPQFMLHPWQGVSTRWSVTEGPTALAPAETAQLRVRAEGAGFYTLAQGRVESADGTRLSDFVIGPYNDYPFPDAIYNADYQLWSLDADVPTGWALSAQPPGIAQAEAVTRQGRNGVHVRANTIAAGLNSTTLETQMLFPLDPFGVWLYPEANEGIPPASILYGLELQSGAQRIILLYGPDAAPPVITPTLYVKRTVIAANAWSYQEIDMQALYAEAGWAEPEPYQAVYRELQADLVPLNVRFTLAASGAVGLIEGTFGPVVQRARYVEPARLMAQALTDPAAYYARLAETHLYMRNFHRAVEAYDTALSYGDDDALRLARQQAAEAAAENLPWWRP